MHGTILDNKPRNKKSNEVPTYMVLFNGILKYGFVINYTYNLKYKPTVYNLLIK